MGASEMQGIAAGLEGFLKGQDWKQRREEDAYNMALKKRQEDMALKQYRAGLFQKGLQETEDGMFAPTAEALADKEFEQNYKTQMLQKQLGDQDLQRRLNEAQLKKLGAETAKTQKEASSEKRGKMIPAGEAVGFGGADAATKELQDLQEVLSANKEMVGPGAGLLSKLGAKLQLTEGGRKAAGLQANLKSSAQTIGKYLEGGKLTDSDIERYVEQLPQITDSPETAEMKIEMLKRKIAQKMQSEKDFLGSAGYDVAGIETNVPQKTKGLVSTAPVIANTKDSEAVQWAKQNLSGPNAEKAKKILQLNGVK